MPRTRSGSDYHEHIQETVATEWVVPHQLGKIPSVTIIDEDGFEVNGRVRHDSINQVTVLFDIPFAGKVYCN